MNKTEPLPVQIKLVKGDADNLRTVKKKLGLQSNTEVVRFLISNFLAKSNAHAQ